MPFTIFFQLDTYRDWINGFCSKP